MPLGDRIVQSQNVTEIFRFECAKFAKRTHALGLVGLLVRGPIDEIEPEIEIAVFKDAFVELFQQPFEIIFLRLEIRAVAARHEIVVQYDDPPHGVLGKIVHPRGQRALRLFEIERAGNDVVVPVKRRDGARFGVQVAHPHETVALDAVPDIRLHAQFHRVRRRIENAVDEFVRTAERTAAHGKTYARIPRRSP